MLETSLGVRLEIGQGCLESGGRSEGGVWGRIEGSRSLLKNQHGRCGEGFWLQPRRRGPRIPAAGCKGRANAGCRQKPRRPKYFQGKGRLALLLARLQPAAGILPRSRRATQPFPWKHRLC